MSRLPMKRPFVILTLFFVASFLLAGQAKCGGLLYAFPPELGGELFPVARISVLSSENFVLVTDTAEERNIAQTFLNDNEFPLESIYLLPIPENVSEPDVGVFSDGLPIQFNVITSSDLKNILRNLAQKYRDHELLELWGERAVMVRPIHLDSREKKTLRVIYKKGRKTVSDLENIRITTIGERYSLGPVGDFIIWVKFKTDKSLRSSLSMTHPITVTEESQNRRLVSVKEQNKKIFGDFELLTTFGGAEFGLRILNQEWKENENYFMLMLEPPIGLADKRGGQPDTDVVFLMDSSGSINASQLNSSKSMILAGLERLKESDKFNVISFDSQVKKLSGKLVNVTAASKGRVPVFLDEIESGGGSDLFNSILTAIDQFNSRKRSGVIILFTDGRPTVGVTNIDSLVDNIRRLNKFKSKIYVVAKGDRPNNLMMERLSAQTGGKVITPFNNESAQGAIDRVFGEISSPSITEVSVEYSDVYPDETFPDSLPVMNGRDTLYVLGNYDKTNAVGAKITARARIQGKVRTSAKSLSSAYQLKETRWLSALWAMRKFGKLLERELPKNDAQAPERLSAISRNYGFIDPLNSPVNNKHLGEIIWDFTSCFVPTRVISHEYRVVKDRLFRLSNGRWTDTDYKTNMRSQKLIVFSDEFFGYLEKNPDLASSFCLGTEVTVVKNEMAIITTLK